MFDEVGNPQAMVPGESPPSFLGFKHDYLQKNPELMLRPTRDRQAKFIAEYFDFLKTLRPGKERSLVKRHPWVFESSVARGGGDAGGGIPVEARRGARDGAQPRPHING